MNAYRSLDVRERLAGRKGRRRELDSSGDGDDLRTVRESGGVVPESGELAHDGLELGHHRGVVSYRD